MKLKVLVLFDGTGCVSKEAKALGHDVKSLDILPLSHIDLPMDILDFKPELLGNWKPDVIWASPPCETFSGLTHMKGSGNLYYESSKTDGRVSHIKVRTDFTIDKRLEGRGEKLTKRCLEHQKFVNKTVEIVSYYEKVNPDLIWCIENPASGYMRYYLMNLLLGVIENLTTYCMYGKSYRKETSVFSNVHLDLKWCPKHKKGVVDLCGGHSDSFAQRYDKKKQPKGIVQRSSYLERSSIPSELCQDIIDQIHEEFVIWG